MSTRVCAVNAYGLILKEEDVIKYLKNFVKQGLSDLTEEELEGITAWEALDFTDAIIGFGEFNGEAVSITEGGYESWGDSTIYDCDDVFVIELPVYPSLFSPAYSSMDEMEIRLRERFHNLLGEDFNYRDVRHLIGTTYA